MAAAFDQEQKYVSGFRRQGHMFFGTEKEPLGRVQAEIAELE